jgi:hypothetical protein
MYPTGRTPHPWFFCVVNYLSKLNHEHYAGKISRDHVYMNQLEFNGHIQGYIENEWDASRRWAATSLLLEVTSQTVGTMRCFLKAYYVHKAKNLRPFEIKLSQLRSTQSRIDYPQNPIPLV